MFMNRYSLVSDFSEKIHYWDTEKEKPVCGTRIDDAWAMNVKKPTCKRCLTWVQKKVRKGA